jgi:2-C-methyl-D-erythritol 4-phosphate cytidylyltransferase
LTTNTKHPKVSAVGCEGLILEYRLKIEATMPTSPQNNVQFFALIPCGGTGNRAGGTLPKQYQRIAGLPMVAHTLAAFAQVSRIAETLTVIAPSDDLFAQHVGSTHWIAPCASDTRAKTVLGGLQAMLAQGATAQDWVLVHDAARCLVTPEQINTLIDACQHDAVGGLLALPLPDTLKKADAGRVASSVNRADKWLAHTPQMFRIGLLVDALTRALGHNAASVTDESSAVEALGQSPKLVHSSAQNFKVTYPEDFAMAEAILHSRKTSV